MIDIHQLNKRRIGEIHSALSRPVRGCGADFADPDAAPISYPTNPLI